MSTRRRVRVLIEPNADVARKLKAQPGKWFLIGVGDLDRSRTLSQTAFRIREGQLADFARDDEGRFWASSTADTNRPDKIADVELSAIWLPWGTDRPGTAPIGADWISQDPSGSVPQD